MKKKLFSSIVMAIVFTLLSNVFLVNAKAASNTNTSQINPQKFQQYVEVFGKHLAKNTDGTLYLKTAKIPSNIDKAYVREAINGINTTNRMIKSGYLVADKYGNITITNKYKNAVAKNNNLEVKTSGNTLTVQSKVTTLAGVNKVVWTWYGCQLYLNSTNANKVAAGSFGAASLALFIPDPLVCKIVAAALGLVGAAVSYANASGKGVIIKINISMIPVPHAVPFWFGSQ
ncbi:hypothetical protein [Gottfriedia acidiceleris]|uniref:hypothetical protein n=1 Tax=Gottfriedia acidiceleris TaxID=371036 RepID=UPI002FFE7793